MKRLKISKWEGIMFGKGRGKDRKCVREWGREKEICDPPRFQTGVKKKKKFKNNICKQYLYCFNWIYFFIFGGVWGLCWGPQQPNDSIPNHIFLSLSLIYPLISLYFSPSTPSEQSTHFGFFFFPKIPTYLTNNRRKK